MKSTLLGIGTTAIILSFGIQAFAEGEHSRFAVGFHLSSLRLDGIGEQAVGASARCTGSLSNHLGLEAVVDHFPENASGNFGETRLLLGVLAGRLFADFGLFAKARAGFIHFGGDFFTPRLSGRTYPSLDLGGVLEYYPRGRIALRFEFGDALIAYGSSSYMGPEASYARLGTRHNLGTALGIGFRF